MSSQYGREGGGDVHLVLGELSDAEHDKGRAELAHVVFDAQLDVALGVEHAGEGVLHREREHVRPPRPCWNEGGSECTVGTRVGATVGRGGDPGGRGA